jgi:hypothetical protein
LLIDFVVSRWACCGRYDRSRVLALDAEITREKAKRLALMDGLDALTLRASFGGGFGL